MSGAAPERLRAPAQGPGAIERGGRSGAAPRPWADSHPGMGHRTARPASPGESSRAPPRDQRRSSKKLLRESQPAALTGAAPPRSGPLTVLFMRFTVRRRNYQHLRDLLPPASSTCNNTPSSSSSPRPDRRRKLGFWRFARVARSGALPERGRFGVCRQRLSGVLPGLRKPDEGMSKPRAAARS